MSSVLATLVAVAVAMGLLRVSIARLLAGADELARGRTHGMYRLGGELAELHGSLRDTCDRPATGDGA